MKTVEYDYEDLTQALEDAYQTLDAASMKCRARMSDVPSEVRKMLWEAVEEHAQLDPRELARAVTRKSMAILRKLCDPDRQRQYQFLRKKCCDLTRAILLSPSTAEERDAISVIAGARVVKGQTSEVSDAVTYIKGVMVRTALESVMAEAASQRERVLHSNPMVTDEDILALVDPERLVNWMVGPQA